MSEVRSKHLTNVLSVGEIQRSIHLIQDVDWGRFEEEEGENERQSDQ